MATSLNEQTTDVVVETEDGIRWAMQRMADEILQMIGATPNWALVGIRSGGSILADSLAQLLKGRSPHPSARGDVDITLYRDDLYTGLEKPVLGATHLPFDVDGSTIVLVDDVLFTGRTVRAAMDEILDYGRPANIRLVVLVDRGHRELPIAPDITGLRIQTQKRDRVVVETDCIRVKH